MKTSIALTLIITIAVFSYVSGYSIGAYNKKGAINAMVSQASIVSPATATAAENISAASNNSPGSEKKPYARGSSPGYGESSPGDGQ